MRHEPHTWRKPALLLGIAAVLIALFVFAATRRHREEQRLPLAGAADTPFAVTRAPGTTAQRLILDCAIPDLKDEQTLRQMASTLYDSHQGADFEQVLIRYRLALPKNEASRRDKPEVKAIAVLTKNASTLGITR